MAIVTVSFVLFLPAVLGWWGVCQTISNTEPIAIPKYSEEVLFISGDFTMWNYLRSRPLHNLTTLKQESLPFVGTEDC